MNRDLRDLRDLRQKRWAVVDDFIQEFNANRKDGSLFFLRHNQFSNMLESETAGMFEVNVAGLIPQLNHSHNPSFLGDFDNHANRNLASVYNFNWATDENAFHRVIVGDVRNQGLCGGCWAFVATACVEASIRKNLNRAFSLSVQELIDCDRQGDRGCAGGNPVNAFRYVVEQGLTTSSLYPFSAQSSQQSTCRYSVNDPVRGSIKGYLTILPNREDLIFDALTLGPVSVALCSSDSTFMYYGGGIYNPSSCCTTLNHAMLIVGHGSDSQLGINYWIVQNSWGVNWGEKGYMRIARKDNHSAGTCGIASTPSLVLGGYLMRGNLNSSAGGDTNNNNSNNVYTIHSMEALFLQYFWVFIVVIGAFCCCCCAYAACCTSCCKRRKYVPLNRLTKSQHNLQSLLSAYPRSHSYTDVSQQQQQQQQQARFVELAPSAPPLAVTYAYQVDGPVPKL